tara:strand:- start:9244 stop:10251 length:1008 start_codon:yes stop_codon:yes gene_type:complete
MGEEEMTWEKILKADFVINDPEQPMGWTTKENLTVVNIANMLGINDFLDIDTHESIHAASQKEIDESTRAAIEKHKGMLLDSDNYRYSERGTMIKRQGFNKWLESAQEDIGATIAFHEIATFLMTEIEEGRNYNQPSTSAIDYTSQFISQAEYFWINVVRLIREGATKMAMELGLEDPRKVFGQRVRQLKEYKEIFSRQIGFAASRKFKEVINKNPSWRNTLQDSLSVQKPESIKDVRSRLKKSKNFKVGKGMEDADFWLISVNTKEKVGTPVEEYNKNHIGVKVLNTEKILPKYMYYHMMNLHSQGYWKQIVRGSVQQFISVQDVKNYLDRVVA